MHLDDDGEAIRRCQRGDIGGLEPLMARYQVAALRLAYLLVGEGAAAEDVVQDSFLLAYQGIARFRPGSAFTPWFYRIVTNTARQRRRRAATRREVSVEWLPSGNEDAMYPRRAPWLRHAIAIQTWIQRSTPSAWRNARTYCARWQS